MGKIDAGELRELYQQFAPVIYRRAFDLLRREADAWDIVHDVFRKLLEDGGAFRREARPMTYIYRIATNLSLNALRARRVREREAGVPEEVSVTGSPGEARELLIHLLDALDARAQQIAVLHFMDGLPQEEVAAVVGLSRKTVGKELARIRNLAFSLSGEEVESYG